LIRHENVVKRLEGPHRAPLGITRPQGWKETTQQQLEPGDRLLIYSDGITEARDQHGVFFGEDQLVELTEHAVAAGLSTPETLRRLATAVLDHQQGRLQDDATLVLVEWSAAGHERMLPSLRASAQRSGSTAEHAEHELGQDQHQQ
jgi:serine phosphatase RsbU (regulator of sigma subunit)